MSKTINSTGAGRMEKASSPQKQSSKESRPSIQMQPADLPADFYIRLLGLPACRQGRPCDGCGKCEH